MRWVKVAFPVLAAAVVCGCRHASYDDLAYRSDSQLDAMEVTNGLQNAAFRTGNYEEADRRLATLAGERTVSSPQYDLEKASLLLVKGEREAAHQMLLKARAEVELLTNVEAEQRAASLWHGESEKVFKGDAHERATLYALLALSFLDRGECEDAIRCVKNGLLADSANTKEAKYNSDYGLLQYVGYVAAAKSGDAALAAEYARELTESMTGRKVSESEVKGLLSEANLPDALAVVWTGEPPSYCRGGEYGEIRHVVPGNSPLDVLTVADETSSPETVLARKLGDVNFQATTRGGRQMDEVLADKASVKRGMKTSGNILLVAGFACLSVSSDNAIAETVILSVGGGCLALGAICHGVGYCINPNADVRAWQNLPGEFVVVPVRLAGARKELTVRGYRQWDNIATEKAVVERREKGVGVTHLSMIPAETVGMAKWKELTAPGRPENK